MNTYNRNGPGISGNTFDRWVQMTNMHDDSTITKMQHQFWVTKQTLSRKLGKKEDECIVASDAELDAKLELFRSIQESCSYLQRIIDKYQERLCNLAQEENAMGRFLKDAGKQDKTRAGKMMTAVGKSLSYSGQQRLALRAPLGRLYQEVETFRQRAIEDTLQKVQAMEKARTEYRAALSWMKNISQELDPDTSKQLERFRKVQTCVRQGKIAFDNLALDCLQKVDLLAAARCNMFSHALVLYQSTLLNFTEKSAQAYSTIASSFKGYQRYDFMVVRELAEPSSKLAQETGGDDDLDEKEKLSIFDMDYHDSVEEAEEVQPAKQNTVEIDKQDEKLLDIDYETKDIKGLEELDMNSSSSNNEITSQSTSNIEHKENLDQLFENLILDNATHSNMQEGNQSELDRKFGEQSLTMDIFNKSDTNLNLADFSSLEEQNSREQSLQFLTSENMVLLNDILTDKQNADNEWDAISHDTFLPPNILKQSLGDAALGIGQKSMPTINMGDKKKNKTGKKGNSWLDLFAELDPLANNPMENLSDNSNASA
ncbi:islet cell autoantigen 1-like protein isoform X1 [Bombus vosnesenskii]|uniref:Islet cell autoantigen 1-like protein isoform X1 n=4 Tax=Pyrobombus TaxID=144703 RepID=A0A6J3KBT5_9HYME|nr:islet cell autoantigen 1-like protein isoform X1 [Bombus vancouverensis nearcticus]XP_033306437.1 islet cell autoantigen 1-like protein isoform X1 [Bombus bifarius]XP_033350235.1 islet cell autoantigen 1-like protein isoform X1 [Bombus vosnesenskii]